MRKVVGVVVVAYNTDILLGDVVASIAKQSGFEVRVVVVDNAAAESTRDLVETLASSELPIGLEYIALPGNPGYGAAANRGIEALEGCDYVVITNPDVTYEPDLFMRLITCFEKHSTVGVVGPSLGDAVSASGVVDTRFPSFASTICVLLHLHRTRIGRQLSRYRLVDCDQRVDWVSGAVMMLSSDVLAHGVRFDEQFFMYMEDVDLCAQAGAAGYAVWRCPSALALHIGGASSAGRAGRVYILSRVSRLLYAQKWSPKSYRPLLLVMLMEALAKAVFAPRGSALTKGPRLWLRLSPQILRDVRQLQWSSQVRDS